MIVVIAPDSFKGSLSAPQAAEAMASGVRRACPDAEIHLVPLADGGEGTLDAVLAATSGTYVETEVTGAHGTPLRAGYGVVEAEGGAVAVIEVARVIGLTLPGMAAVSVAERTTRGLGELMRHCLDHGLRRFWIGLGGSATNDAGVGMLAELGMRPADEKGTATAANLGALEQVAAADFSGLDPRLGEAEMILLADVDNPLCGDQGATAVFGPQKGVAPADVAVFDGRLRRFAALADAWFGSALSREAGTGAAGGLGYAFRLIGARSRSGAEAVCELAGLDRVLAGADWLVTGEGHSDAQTPRGKTPWVAALHARRLGVPATLISGGVDESALPALRVAFDDCLGLAGGEVSVEEAIERAAALLSLRTEEAAETHCA